MNTNHRFSPLPTGIGYRPAHRASMQALRPAVGFLEVHAENYMLGGRQAAELDALRRDWHVSLHGVGLSLGSVERPDALHLDRLAALAGRVEPILVSEHLSFSNVGGDYLNDLLPLPMTPIALRVVCRNVDIVQERLGRQILVENPSRYLDFRCSSIPEPEFLNELARRTGCGVLLDLNNVHVTCANVGGDARRWCDALRRDLVGEIHLAGHSRVDADGELLLIDDHAAPVSAEVWALYDAVIAQVPMTPTLVEWDGQLPPLPRLLAEAERADARRDLALSDRRLAAAGGRHAHAH
jgi:uncharacterized protein (UPF0276 family)